MRLRLARSDVPPTFFCALASNHPCLPPHPTPGLTNAEAQWALGAATYMEGRPVQLGQLGGKAPRPAGVSKKRSLHAVLAKFESVFELGPDPARPHVPAARLIAGAGELDALRLSAGQAA